MGGGMPDYVIGEDDVLRITFPAGAHFDDATARRAVARHLEVAAGRQLLTLVDVSQLRSMDRKARDLVSGPAVSAVTLRLAIVVGGPISAMIANFFLRVTRPQYPTQMFSSRQAAEAWLLRGSSRGRASVDRGAHDGA